MDDIVYLIIALAVVAVLAYFSFFYHRGKKKEKKNKKEFDMSVERFENLNFKKCRQCGGEVPKDDNICPNCNQIP